MSGVRRVVSLLLLALAPACSRSEAPQPTPAATPQEEPSTEVRSRPVSGKHFELPLIDRLRFCEVRHDGIFIDTGSELSDAHRNFHPGPFDRSEIKKRAGQPSAFLTDRRRSYDFWLDAENAEVTVSLRVRGDAASRVYASLDGRALGARRLNMTEATVVSFGPLAEPLAPGRHTVGLRFSGRRKATQAYAQLDWIRVHLPMGDGLHYVPPTARTLQQDIVLGAAPRRSIVLRADSSVRCPFVPRPGARLRLDVGYRGTGSGVARVAARLDSGQSVVLAEHRLEGGRDATWLPLDLALDAFSGRIVAIEFSTLAAKQGGLIAFGEPRLLQSKARPAPIEPKLVVVVVSAGLRPQSVPPWGERSGLSQIFRLTQAGTTFENYRVPTTFAAGVLATLLTGLPLHRHKVLDPGAALPASVPTLADALRQVGARSAFFSNVPYSFRAFGFARGFSVADFISPAQDRPGSAPLLRAKQWLEAELADEETPLRFILVHEAGGHPPWDVTRDEAAMLEPHDYNGIIEPRRGAVILRQVRGRQRRSSRKLGPNDWRRLEALQHRALAKQDTALGHLAELIIERGLWQDTLFVWMGDVSMGQPPEIPFAPLGDLDDGHLLVPLIVKFPGADQGTRYTGAVGTPDVAQTLQSAILGASGEQELETLGDYVAGAAEPIERGQLALSGAEYTFDLGRYRLHGVLGRQPALCERTVDPACELDHFGEDPFVSKWLWRLALEQLVREFGSSEVVTTQPAKLDRDTRAALTVFGL